MKKILPILLLTIMSVSVSHGASPFQFGVKAGLLLNSSRLQYDFANSPDYDHKSSKPGFEVGFQGRVNLPAGFMLQPEIVYSRASAIFPEINGAEDLRVRTNWMEVPVLLGWKVSIFRIMAGPVFRFNMDEVLSINEGSIKIAPELDNFVMGYQAGVGVDLGRFTIDARYCGNFSKILDEEIVIDSRREKISINEGRVAISLGFMILK